ASPSRATLDRELWARLNAPLRAWPSAQWFSASEAVPEVPVGALPPSLALYDQVVPAVLQRTRNEIRAKGLEGVMTFGSFPRQWGNPLYSDEIDCGGDDPTPADDWDDPYWCATFTDYHSAASTPTIWAMRSGDVSWLPELATPAALRMLHTQIYQCGPGDATFYCGQAPNGYGGYRNNFNGSHAYFDNLLLHYWLTGDETIVRTLRRGAATMRAYVCPSPPCSATQPPADFWAQFTGRVAMQWVAVFRFLGLASDDATYLDDVRSLLARATTQNHVEAVAGGRTFGFMTYGGDLIGAAGTYDTDQLWMNALYDGQELYRFEVDTQNASIGSPAVGVRTVRESLARTLAVYGPNVLGDGTAGTVWPNSLRFKFAGARIGGTLTSVVPPIPNPNCGLDECLYDTGKGTLTASLVRAGQTANEPDVLAVGRGLTERVLGVSWNNGNPEPLGKNQGEYLVRTHAAVARLAWGDVPAQTQTGLGYYFIPPCRLVDTRDPSGPFGGPALGANGERTFALAGRCGVPASAKAITANLTALYPGAGGVLSAGRGDLPAPDTTGVAFGGPGLVRASMLMIATTTDGSASVKVRNRSAAPAEFVLDVSGYLE
ncbi:MAG: hypothetical protein JNK60_14860, partial [Acidobacteria bacterium]|nr:hypothetical protein [Acidobacteriota bacterium]